MSLTSIRFTWRVKNSCYCFIQRIKLFIFATFFEMRDQIAKHEQDFARGFTESLLAYGLGRPYGYSDRNLADKILTEAGGQENQISAFIHALIQTKAFRQK